MRFFADLHVHGPFSRGTSKALSIPKLEQYARIKGIGVMGTGDFTHPTWLEQLKASLSGEGVLRTESGFPFILSTELSSIFTDKGRTRKIHHVILAPSFDAVDGIRDALLKLGRLDYDGRPIFKLSCPEVIDLVMGVDKQCEVIPAHIWTPWFALFGSNSGYDSLKDAYEDTLKHVHAYETGLSSDPPMNWRVSQLDKLTTLSFSDLHSFWPWRIGREATIFDCDLTYDAMLSAIRNNTVAGTIEVDPSYGKYHLDGHRACDVCFEPSETREHNGKCPKCGRPLTIGVLNRVEELADREEGYHLPNAKPFHTLMPLSELISHVFGMGIATRATWKEYDSLVRGSSEYAVLMELPREELEKRTHVRIADEIIKSREHAIKVKPGYDGVYGEPEIQPMQKKLGDWS